MIRFTYLSSTLAVAGALAAEDFERAAAHGFDTIINNRPDGEQAGQLTAAEEAELAGNAGIGYVYLPAAKHEVLETHFVDALEDALAQADGRVLLHCRSGLRSAIAWAAVAVRSGASLEKIIQTATAAGLDLAAVREEIAAYAPEHSGEQRKVAA